MDGVIVIVGASPGAGNESEWMPESDRAALGLAFAAAPHETRAFVDVADGLGRAYALAAGAKDVRPLSELETSDFRLALVGLGAIDRLGLAFAGALAERRQAVLALDVLEVRAGPTELIVTKDLGRGAREEWTVCGSLVAVVSPLARKAPYVSRFRVRMAATRSEGLSEPRVPRLRETTWFVARPRVRLGSLSATLGGSTEDRVSRAFGATNDLRQGDSQRAIQAEPEVCAEYLLRFLGHHGFLSEALSGAPQFDLAAPQPAVSLPAGQAPRDAQSASQQLTTRVARGPRQVNRQNSGLARRPRPFDSEASAGRQAEGPKTRRPRPLGDQFAGPRRAPVLLKKPSSVHDDAPTESQIGMAAKAREHPTRP